MHLALGAVLLTILLIPPLIFYYCYSAGGYAKAAPKLSLLEYLLISAVLSLLLHCVIIYLWRLDIDFEFLFRMLSGQMTEKYIVQSGADIPYYIHQFSLYIVRVCLCMAFIGWLTGRIMTLTYFRMSGCMQRIRNNEFPASSLKYYNHWWYYFRANQYKSEYKYLGYDS